MADQRGHPQDVILRAPGVLGAELGDAANPLVVADDYGSFEAQHVTLIASTDTTITFAQSVRLVRVSNWDTVNRVLVKDGAIASDGDTSAARVGKAPTADVPNSEVYPISTTTIHLRSVGSSEVTCEGFF